MKIALLSILFFALDLLIVGAAFLMLPNTTELNTANTIYRPSFQDPKTQIKISTKSSQYIPYSKIPKTLVQSVLYLEDGRFWQHRGFDFFEIKEAVMDSAKEGKRLRGASTISQQLVKNLYLNNDRTWIRKLKEALITIKLENSVSKRKILELYLNSIDWGKNLIGIGSASEYYFGVFPSELGPRQSTFLAAIIPNPSRYGEQPDKLFVRKQSLRALEHLYRTEVIDLSQFQDAIMERLPDDE